MVDLRFAHFTPHLARLSSRQTYGVDLTPKQFEQALAAGDPETIRLARAYSDAVDHPLYSWQPRPDRPALFDCQAGLVLDRQHRVAVGLGGTGGGKTTRCSTPTS
jgi:CubicO group peptidase (beta-lactamase class C family)